MKQLGPKHVALLRAALLAYFHRNRRDFPWRLDKDPYRVLVSEVMLQQTRAASVVPYFESWMKRFPTITALAEASEEDVLKAWEGLGYYSRAVRLHRAARQIVGDHGGRVPPDFEDLLALPGIGPYTAGAVASIAYGIPAGAVDGNARRVLARLMEEPRPSAPTLSRWAAALVDPTDPGSFNQALMEVGAQICRPKRPRCGACPISRFCATKRSGKQETIPLPRSRKPVPRVTMVCVGLVWRGGDCPLALVRRRPTGRLLGGMWELPELEVSGSAEVDVVAHELARRLTNPARPTRVRDSARSDHLENCRVGLGLPHRLEPVEHEFTHRRMTYVPFVFEVSEVGWLPDGEGPYRWASSDEARRLPMGGAQLKVLKQVI